MDATPPNAPPPPAIECNVAVTTPLSDAVLKKLKLALPNTQISSAWESCIPGWTAVRLSNGTMGYVDKSGRYFVLGIAIDLDKRQFLDKQADGSPE